MTEEELPQELQNELAGKPNPKRKYTVGDLILAYLAYDGGDVSVDELAIYLYKAMNGVTGRGYIRNVLTKLRKEGWVFSVHPSSPILARSRITDEGLLAARPYLPVGGGDE